MYFYYYVLISLKSRDGWWCIIYAFFFCWKSPVWINFIIIIICVHLKTFFRFRWEMLIMSCYSVGKLLVLQHLTLQSEIHIGIQIPSSPEMNGIGFVLVSILSSANDCGFEPQSGQTKNCSFVKCFAQSLELIFRKFKHPHPLVWHSFTFICYTRHHTKYKRKHTLSHINFYNNIMFACFICSSHVINFGYVQVVHSVFASTDWARVTYYVKLDDRVSKLRAEY